MESLASKALIPNAMQVTVRIRRAVVVHHNIDTFDINTTAENISGHKDALLEGFEGSISIDTEFKVNFQGNLTLIDLTHRSSCAKPEWIQILGKLQETSNLSNSMQRATDLTKITTWDIP